MIKSMLIAAVAIPSNPLCAPVLAEQVTSPKSVVVAASPVKSTSGDRNAAMFSAFNSGESSTPPVLSLGIKSIDNNIACRSKARTKLFEVGARDMSSSESNSQWATVGSMRVLVWCRDTQVINAVSGNNFDSVTELRDELQKAF